MLKKPFKTLKLSQAKTLAPEPSTPPRMNLDGMNKLIRVSHLTLVAKDLVKTNQPSQTLDMPRVRELNLDVKEDELSMLKQLIDNQKGSDFKKAMEAIPCEPIMVKPWGGKMVPSKFQRPLASPQLENVNLDAESGRKIARERSTSLENSPVIQAKKPRRAFFSHEIMPIKGS